jgi:hypothetical protein
LTIKRQQVEERVLAALRAWPTSTVKGREPLSWLEIEESRTVAAEAIRALVEAILLEPHGEHLKITLRAIWREC